MSGFLCPSSGRCDTLCVRNYLLMKRLFLCEESTRHRHEYMTIEGKKPKIARLPYPGDVIDNRYRLGEAFATGGMGVIMKAEQLRTGRQVAVKILHPHIVTEKNFAARFRREAKVATLFDHSSIVRVYDVGETKDGVLYLVMELLVGEELQDIIQREAPLPVSRALTIGLQMLDGLAEAHSQGVVHRDIKPANVFVCKTRRGEDDVKLLDFGVAKLINTNTTQMTAAGSVTGTPSFIAPEMMFNDKNINYKAADVYAAGLVILEMITGQRAFTGNGLAETLLLHLKQPLALPRAISESALGPVIRKATVKHPDDRYADADEMYLALKDVRFKIPPNLSVGDKVLAEPNSRLSSTILEKVFDQEERNLAVLRDLPQHVIATLAPAPKQEPPRQVPPRQVPPPVPGGGISSSGDDDFDDFDVGPTKVLRPSVKQNRQRYDEDPSPAPDPPAPSVDLVSPAPSATPAPTPRANTRPIAVIAGAVVLLLVGALGVGWMISNDKEASAEDSSVEPQLLAADDEPEPADDEQDLLAAAELHDDDEPEEAPIELSFVRVESDPSGASVFSGNERLGATTFELEFAPQDNPGSLRLRKDGYHSEFIELSGTSQEFLVELKPKVRQRAVAADRPTSSPSQRTDTSTQSESAESNGTESRGIVDVDNLIDQHLFND